MLLLMLALGCGDAASPAMNHPAMSAAEMPAKHAQAFDEMFIDMMVPHHQGAVAMAVIANERAEHPEIKAMAGRIIASQEAEITTMKGWRKAWFGSEETPAMDMPMKHADMAGMDRMPGMSSMKDMAGDIEALKTAEPFDLAFLDAMIPHHEGAVAMAADCADKSEHPEVKALALDITEDQRKEIAQMREWRAAWYPSAPAAGQGAAMTGTVWVADELGNSILVIDAATNEPVVTLTGIEGPHNLQVAPDGKSVWAVSGHASTAVMIDATNYTLHGAVPTGKDPAHVVLLPNGSKAYVTNGSDDTVTVIDTATMKSVATIAVGTFPHGLRASPDGRWVYVANAKGTTLSVIDATTDTKVADIEVGQKPVQVGFAPDGRFVYFSLNAENAIGKVDVGKRALVGKVPVGIGPIQVFVTPDNRYVLAANQGTEDEPSMTVSIIDTATFAVVGTVETGKGAHGVVIDPSSRYAYISNIYDDDIAVLDIAARTVVMTIPSGDGPNGISFSPLAPAVASSKQIQIRMPGHEGSKMSGMSMP